MYASGGWESSLRGVYDDKDHFNEALDLPYYIPYEVGYGSHTSSYSSAGHHHGSGMSDYGALTTGENDYNEYEYASMYVDQYIPSSLGDTGVPAYASSG
jgi:hypothetical protein